MRIMGQLTINRLHDFALLTDENVIEEIEYQVKKNIFDYSYRQHPILWASWNWKLKTRI